MSAMSEVAKWAKAESAKLEADWPKGSQQEKDLIAYWRQNRPRMTAALLKENALAEMAHVVLDRAQEMAKEQVKAGLPPSDARQEAERLWLMREPETEDQPLTLSSLRQRDQITTSPTPSA